MDVVEAIMKIFVPYLNLNELDAMSEATGNDWEQEFRQQIAKVIDSNRDQ